MAAQGDLKVSKVKTRHQSGSQKLREYVGNGKELDMSEVPTVRAVIQKGLLIKETWLMESDNLRRHDVSLIDVAKEVAPVIIGQWLKSNAKFVPPVVLVEHSIVNKVKKLWQRVENVAQGKGGKAEKVKVDALLDKLLDITICPHTIMLCDETGSGCHNQEDCKIKAHIKCTCIASDKLPVMELEWLYHQRETLGEKAAE